MVDHLELKETSLLCVIVNCGFGSKVLRVAKQHGVLGGTVFLGKGTVRNRLLEFFDICDVRKEIVLMVGESEVIQEATNYINKEFHLHKPYHGIAFIMPVVAFLGTRKNYKEFNKDNGGAHKAMYHSIFTVVDKGKGEMVMEAANKAGAKGGTIINARGTGVHETSKVFNIDIEPEKEIVLILSEETLTEQIVKAIGEDLEINKPGNGVVFVQNVTGVYGVSE